MYRVKKIFLLCLPILLYFISSNLVYAKECVYTFDDGNQLKIVDGEVDTTMSDKIFKGIDIISNLLTFFTLDVDSGYEMSNEVKSVFQDDKCATKFYACQFVGIDYSVSSLLRDTAYNKNLLYDAESFKSTFYYDLWNNGKKKGEYKYLLSSKGADEINEKYNECSQGVDKGFGKFAGKFCTIGPKIWRKIKRAVGAETYYYHAIKCRVGESDDPDAVDSNCSEWFKYKEEYNRIIENYKQCGDNLCKKDSVNDLNSYEDKIKTMCYSMVKHYDYDDYQSECLDTCFNISEILNDMKKGTDLYIDYSTKQHNCNLSDRVIKWIANIVKWLKYVVPVLVIIFGIMDFIKAIAAQSEDEMKKAQSRFIRRLIVAALVFIVPYLIEYILTAFNLVSDDPYCGII